MTCLFTLFLLGLVAGIYAVAKRDYDRMREMQDQLQRHYAGRRVFRSAGRE